MSESYTDASCKAYITLYNIVCQNNYSTTIAPPSLQGRPINDIDYYGCPTWPDMQDLINHCLQYTPDNRPSAQEVFDRLCSTEFVSLKRAVQVEKDQPVQMFATRVSTGCVCVNIHIIIQY